MDFDIVNMSIVGDIVACFGDGMTVKEILSEYSQDMEDEDESPMVYIGLGIAHLENEKRISDSLKNKILTVVDSDILVRRFQCEGCYPEFLEWKESFKKNLQEQRERLTGQAKKSSLFFRKLMKKTQIDDVCAYRMKKENENEPDQWVVYRVLEKDEQEKEFRVHVACLPDMSLPSEKDFARLVFLPNITYRPKLVYRLTIFKGKENTEETGRLVYLGNYPDFPKVEDEWLFDQAVYYAKAQHDHLDNDIMFGIRFLKKQNLL